MKIDVIVSTWNSAKRLDECLQSIFENIPVNTLYVVDKFSKDDTVKIAEKYGAKIVQSDCSLAESRKLGFNLVETELFVNVDSDVVLCQDWFRKMLPYMNDPKVGCVWGTAVHQEQLHNAYQMSMLRFRGAEHYRIPHLPDMLARKSLLKDIVIPKQLHGGSIAGEDWLIMQWIEDHGYICKSVPVFVKHYTYPSLLHNKTFWGGSTCRRMHRKGLIMVLRQVILSYPQALFCAVLSRNARVIPYWLTFRMEELYGYLHWDKYGHLPRGGEGK